MSMIQHLIKRKPPSQIYVCIYCLGVWSDDARASNMEPREIRMVHTGSTAGVYCVECKKKMICYNRAEVT